MNLQAMSGPPAATVVLALMGSLLFPVAAVATTGNGNGTAAITGSFRDSCGTFETYSTKDISHVVVSYSDGRVVKDESIDGQAFSVGGAANEIASVTVKSATTTSTFGCEDNPAGECSDGIDNDGNGLTDFPEDPDCGSAEDNDEGSD